MTATAALRSWRRRELVRTARTASSISIGADRFAIGHTLPYLRSRMNDGSLNSRVVHRESDAQLLRDDRLHDLGRAAVDALNTRVDERPRHRVLTHIAVAAVQLQTAVGHAHLQFGGPPFQP